MAIVALDQNTVKFLTTAQVVTSVSTAVKELVENALDAQANSLEIKLGDNGASLIEVSDNGKGISEDDAPFMALQSYTSKIRDFGDLDKLASYGFRGEALSSLCRVAEVTVITKTEQDVAARLYRMNHDGTIKSYEFSHRTVGTTIQARSLFKDLPVRRQILTNPRRSGRDIKVLESLLRSFAVCHPEVRLTYRVNNKIIFTKPSTQTTRDNLALLFGKKFLSQMEFVEKKSAEGEIHLTIPKRDASELSDICVCGQHVFVNRRPVSYREIEKAVNGRLVQHFEDKIPGKKSLDFLLNLTVSPGELDVNLEPNKTSVLLANQAKLIETLDKILVTFYGIDVTEEEKQVEKAEPEKDATAEYLDLSMNDSLVPESPEVRSVKKRKVEDNVGRTVARDASTVKRGAALVGDERTPKRSLTAKKLFETPAARSNCEENKENYSRNPPVENEASQVASETISQIPEVDLGEDFDPSEIDSLPSIDPDQLESVLKKMSNEESSSSTSLSSEVVKMTEEAWSKGQVPIKLHGGTDVLVYNNAVDESTPEAGKNALNSDSAACRGSLQFFKEMRPKIMREIPGINFVEMAKTLTARWKALSSEERGFYRDLAEAEKSQRSSDTSISLNKSTKRDISSEEAEDNKKRFLNMLDKMKHARPEKKKDNRLVRTIVPMALDMKTLTKSFGRHQSSDNSCNKKLIVGRLDENVWLVRTGIQIWALNLNRLLDGLGVSKPEANEKMRDTVENLMERWLNEKDDLSLLHPVFELS